jgi:hypothetical protein
MTHLDMTFITARPWQLSERQFSSVHRTQVFPETPLSVIRETGMDLGDFDLSDAFHLAQLHHQFLDSDKSLAYRQSFQPDSRWIHPCAPRNDITQLANSLREHGLHVCYMVGSHDVPHSEGFMLTASKSDFSADLASAYLLAGCVPPHQLLLRGLEKNAHGPLEQLYQQATSQVIKQFTELVDQLDQFVDPDFASKLAP